METIFVAALKEETPELWTTELKNRLRQNIINAVEMEIEWGISCINEGILGITPVMIREYIQFIGDMRLEAIGLGKEFNSSNPFPWLDEFTQSNMIETNFFEGTVREYQSGTLEW